MTPDRLNEIIAHCFRIRRLNNHAAHYGDIARFLDIDRATLHRWQRGEAPIPKMAAIIFETFIRWPEVTAEGVDEGLREREEAGHELLRRG